MLTSQVQLPEGEALTSDEILTGFLLLARAECPFPVVTSSDALVAVVLLMQTALEYNDERSVI